MIPCSARSGQQVAGDVAPESNELNLGKTTVGNKLKGVFRVINSSSEQIEFTRIVASCGCTTTGSKADFVAPGASAEIDVELAGKMHDESVTSSIAVEWKSVGGKSGAFKVNIQGQFVAPFELIPNTVSLQLAARRGEEVIIWARNLNPGIHSIKLESNFSSQQFDALIETVSNSESRLTFKINTTEMFSGSNRFNVKIIGLDKEGKRLGENMLPVIISISDDVKIEPNQILANVSPSQSVLKEVSIFSESDTPFKITKIYSDADWLSGKRTSDHGDIAKQQIQLDITGAGTAIKANLFIVFSQNDSLRTLRVPIFRTVNGGAKADR